jgi:Domain of unknown function (DUF4157)/OmpA family
MQTYKQNIIHNIKTYPSTKNLFFQPKLTINNSNDQFEKEADAMADKVMRMPQPLIQAKPIPINSVQRKCAHCEEEEKQMQRKEMNGSETNADHTLENYIGNINGSGQSLSNEVRNFYEPRFCYDFSNVKVHTDSVAAKSAQSINALAYTSGNNIVFNSGEYSPNTDSGKRLLGHELTHVIQQGTNTNVVRRQEDPSARPPEIEPPPNSITIDLLDPANSSVRIQGFSLPSPRDILNGVGRLGDLVRGSNAGTDFQWPPPALTPEQIHEAACRITPTLCNHLTVLPNFTPPNLTLPPIQLRIPRLLFHAHKAIDHFIFDKSNIPDRHRVELDQSATELIDNINLITDITAHTDTKGDAAYNQPLSEKRAHAVEGYFLDRNVPASQIWNVTGMGERQPLYNDDRTNPLSASRNRRVELDMRRMVWDFTFPSLGLPSLQMPASVLGIQDTRQRVLDPERPQFDRLRDFMHRIRNEIGQLLANPAPNPPFAISDNENVRSLLQVMDSLINDLDAETLVIRFDQPGNTPVAASYTVFADIVHVQPAVNDNSLPSIAVDLVHEFAHAIQDRTAEQLQRAARTPLAHTREDELRQEIESRRHETYLLLLLSHLGHRFEFNKEITARVFVNRFERERTGNPQVQEQARREIRSSIEGPYSAQLASNSPMRRYLVEIHSDRHAHLVRDGGATNDLGAVPAGVTTSAQLDAFISTAIQSANFCRTLFTDNRGTSYRIIQILVFDSNRKVAEFGLDPSACV